MYIYLYICYNIIIASSSPPPIRSNVFRVLPGLACWSTVAAVGGCNGRDTLRGRPSAVRVHRPHRRRVSLTRPPLYMIHHSIIIHNSPRCISLLLLYGVYYCCAAFGRSVRVSIHTERRGNRCGNDFPFAFHIHSRSSTVRTPTTARVCLCAAGLS